MARFFGSRSKPPKERASVSLRREIVQELDRAKYSRSHRKVNFVSLGFISGLFKFGTPTKLHLSLQDDLESLQHDGSEEQVKDPTVEKLESFVLDSASKLYTILLLIGESHRIVKIFSDDRPPDDGMFVQKYAHEQPYCSSDYLNQNQHFQDIAEKFFQKQWCIPPVLRPDNTPKFPLADFRFPFETKPRRLGGGAGGQVWQVKISSGHLIKGDKPTSQVSSSTAFYVPIKDC
jgi:hypothetical protein